MLANHIDHDGQRDHERRVYALGNIDGVAIAEKRELAAYLRHQVAIGVDDREVPVVE